MLSNPTLNGRQQPIAQLIQHLILDRPLSAHPERFLVVQRRLQSQLRHRRNRASPRLRLIRRPTLLDDRRRGHRLIGRVRGRGRIEACVQRVRAAAQLQLAAAAVDVVRPVADQALRIETGAGSAALAHPVAVHTVQEDGTVVGDRLQAERLLARRVAGGLHVQHVGVVVLVAVAVDVLVMVLVLVVVLVVRHLLVVLLDAGAQVDEAATGVGAPIWLLEARRIVWQLCVCLEEHQ